MKIFSENNSCKYFNIPNSLNKSNKILNSKASTFFLSETFLNKSKSNKTISIDKKINENEINYNYKCNFKRKIKLPVLGNNLNNQSKNKRNDNFKEKMKLNKRNHLNYYPQLNYVINSDKDKDISSFFQFEYMKTLFKNNISLDKLGKKNIFISGRKINFEEEKKLKIKFPKPILKKRKLNLFTISNI